MIHSNRFPQGCCIAQIGETSCMFYLPHKHNGYLPLIMPNIVPAGVEYTMGTYFFSTFKNLNAMNSEAYFDDARVDNL